MESRPIDRNLSAILHINHEPLIAISHRCITLSVIVNIHCCTYWTLLSFNSFDKMKVKWSWSYLPFFLSFLVTACRLKKFFCYSFVPGLLTIEMLTKAHTIWFQNSFKYCNSWQQCHIPSIKMLNMCNEYYHSSLSCVIQNSTFIITRQSLFLLIGKNTDLNSNSSHIINKLTNEHWA